MNVLLKKEVCGSHKQCTGSTGKAEMHFSKKKKKKKSETLDAMLSEHSLNA